MRKLVLVCLLFFFSLNVFAFEDPKKYPDIEAGFVEIVIDEPQQKVGYTVGDLINRTIHLSIKKPYELIEESLPIVGYEKRYRGQLLGMDLRRSSFEKKESEEITSYTIKLQYQIFTNNVVAKPAFITADYYRLMNPLEPEKIVKFRVPELTVAVSPIAIFGDVKIENDMSDYRGPLLMDTTSAYEKINIAFMLLLVALFTLVYIYSRFSWVPRQNKFFNRVYQQFKKKKPTDDNLEDFLKALHHAFDRTLDQTFFLENDHMLYQQNGTFKNIKKEITQFFQISRAIFFEKNPKKDLEKTYQWLIQFALHCRMSERKLIVDKADIKGL